ncbi:WD40 repeat-like protein, partial [Coemansia reversa NRRL 1564]
MSKAPQLDALPPVDDETEAPAHRPASEKSSAHVAEHEDDSDESETSQYTDTDRPDPALLAREYQAAATTQRCDSKTHAVDAWRFISPRVKRVKRRVLWRLFLAQELTPAIYDEATGVVPVAGSPQPASNSKASSPHAIWAMEFSVCGKYLAAGGQDGVVRIWRVAPFARAQAHEKQQQLDARAQLHPMHAYELLEPVPFRSYVGHGADVLALSWSKNGFLLSASMDRTVRLWHPHRPECLCTFRHRDIVTSVAFSPRDDRLFISGSLDCRLRLWDIPARGVRQWTRLPDGQMVTSVAFTSPKGDHIVAGTYRGMCVFYSTADLAVQGRMHARSSRGRNSRGSKITGFAFAPTGQLPAPLLQRLLGSQAAALFSEQRLLVSSNDSRLRLFLPAAREVERKYKGHANVSSQAYARLSSDGRYIVSGSEDHNIYAWESLDGKVEEKSIYEFFPAHDAAVSQALFAPAATLQYLADHNDPIL